MNARWIRILLVLLVSGIWGAVLMKAFVRHTAGPVVLAASNRATAAHDTIPLPDAPLDLHLERDPFLDASLNSPHPASPQSEQASKKTTGPPKAMIAPVHWPQVEYKGSLGATHKATAPVVILSIDGHEQVLRVGDAQNGLTVVKATRDSVVIALEHEQRTFARK